MTTLGVWGDCGGKYVQMAAPENAKARPRRGGSGLPGCRAAGLPATAHSTQHTAAATDYGYGYGYGRTAPTYGMALIGRTSTFLPVRGAWIILPSPM